jgi:hypothetical protein
VNHVGPASSGGSSGLAIANRVASDVRVELVGAVPEAGYVERDADLRAEQSSDHGGDREDRAAPADEEREFGCHRIHLLSGVLEAEVLKRLGSRPVQGCRPPIVATVLREVALRQPRCRLVRARRELRQRVLCLREHLFCLV